MRDRRDFWESTLLRFTPISGYRRAWPIGLITTF
jgi:hypothetical protein